MTYIDTLDILLNKLNVVKTDEPKNTLTDSLNRGRIVANNYADDYVGDIEELLRHSGHMLGYCSDFYKTDKNLVMIAVGSDKIALKYMDETFYNDHDVMKFAIEKYGGSILQFITPSNSRREIIILAVSNCGCALQWVDEELRDDRYVVSCAVSNDGNALKWASERLRGDKAIVICAVVQNSGALRFASAECKSNKVIILEAVKNDGCALAYISEGCLDEDDDEIANCAVKNNGASIAYVPAELQKQNGGSLFRSALITYPEALELVCEEIQANKELVMCAVSSCGKSLRYASTELKNDKDVVVLAMSNDQFAFKYAGYELKNNKEILINIIWNNENPWDILSAINNTD